MTEQIEQWLEEAQRHAFLGRTEPAERLCRSILDIVPGHAGAMLVLANSLYFQRKAGDAIPLFESVLQHEPDNREARNHLLYCYKENGDVDQALKIAQDFCAHSHHPDDLLAAYLALDAACEWEQAGALHGRILDMADAGLIHHIYLPSLMMALNAAPGMDPHAMYTIHKRWGDAMMHMAGTMQLHGQTPPPKDGRLKIAYISADFYHHPVKHFIQPLISFHDRRRFEVYCYARLIADDNHTAQIRESADHFIDVTQCSPEQMAQRIRDDGIHILIELGGHTSMSCLSALALKPAPVQITYLGYPNTTGLSTVDFRITDAHAEDEVHGTRYVEELLCMPQSFLCAKGYMEDVKRAEAAPVTRNGYITFGSFNHVRKLNPETIELWSRILQQVDQSRLMIKSMGSDSPRIRKNILAAFARHGIDGNRIDFYPLAELYSEHTAAFNNVDIALDAFPYNGTTTTCETLWMGVPVVTLVGPQHVQRTSYSILKNIGLDATIAHTPDEYVAKAIRLAGNINNLGVLRQCLPTMFRHSPLGQPEAFARQFEALCLEAWSRKGYPVPELPREGHGQPEKGAPTQGDAETGPARPDHARHAPGIPDAASPHPGKAGTMDAAGSQGTRMLDIAGGIRIAVPDDLNLMTPYILREQQDWFEDEIKFVRTLVQPGMHAIDIGANYGCYTLSIGKLLGRHGRLWAFEPASSTSKFLAQSIAANALDNVEIIRAALSDHGGEATLSLAENAEANAIVDGQSLPGRAETVPLLTLDDSMQRFAWTDIAFVKLDAEGQEMNILRGGHRFFAHFSPLVMFELKHGDQVNAGLIRAFRDLGYGIYALVPGLMMLRPVADDEAMDAYQLNLFACKQDRAESLASAGLLAMTTDMPDGVAAMLSPESPLLDFAYARTLYPTWESSLSAGKHAPGWECYIKALNAFVEAHNAADSPAQRLGHLQNSFMLLTSLLDVYVTVPRLMSLARVAAELGQRMVAVQILEEIIKHFEQHPHFLPDEPFLAVSERAALMDPDSRIGEWAFGQVLAEHERLQAFSSYFTGNTSLPKLEVIETLGYADAEMQRRKDMIHQRFREETPA